MKKIYKKIQKFIVPLLGLATFSMEAQLSGTVTINSSAPTAGTNYQTFNALATDLNTNGVSGPLTINVLPGQVPFVEQVIFFQSTGMGAANRITINGNGNTLTFNSTTSSMPHTLLLNGADYMNFNDLNIIGQGSSYAMVCVLTGGANYNTFNTCTFSAPLNGVNTTQCPFAITSSSTSPTSGGINSGNYNTVNTCTMSNGYYGCVFYGLTGAPYQTGNSLINSRITDFYIYGFYYPYQNYITVKNNTVDRMTRTTSSTVYGFYGQYQQGAMIDGNKVWKLFESNPGSTSACYAMYIYYTNTSNGVRNTVRNNIITDIKSNGTLYGMYNYYSHSNCYNNTIDLDWSGSTGSGTIYGMYPYGTAGYDNVITNNIITCRRGGSGSSRYGMYIAATGNIFVDRNNIVMVAGSGTNNHGYYGGAWQTLTQWQTAGCDVTGFSADPMYISSSDLHPTNVAINDAAIPYGLVFDQLEAVRNQATPDIGALEFLSPACIGTPTLNSVSGASYPLCPGETVTLGLGNLSPTTGYTYSWSASQTSPVGPFNITLPGNNTGLFYTTPPAVVNTWYNLAMTCSNPGGGTVNQVGFVQIAGPTTSVVPCGDSFEGIGNTNRLPNCSWASNSLGGSCQTYIQSGTGNRVPNTGTSFASFDNSTPGTNYFYTNPITMNTGITYSAEVMWATEYFGNNNWPNLSIMVGPNQNPTGMVTVASINNPISGSYKLLGNTFTVPSTGTYYVAIKATSASGGAQFLSIDDLKITIPCEDGSPNSPTVTLSAGATTVCSGQPVNLSASGADTYTWSTGANGSGITDNPFMLGPVTYYVMGSNAITGCVSTVSQVITVIPSPVTLIYANPATVCSGEPVVLTALGAASYVWSNGGTMPIITITPTVGSNPGTINLNVIGTDPNGCSSNASQAILVNPLPSIAPNSSNSGDACKDDQITLTASGGLTYQWTSNTLSNLFQGNPLNVTLPVGVTIFTVVGTNANGCSGKNTLTQNVVECTSINKYESSLTGFRVYPNPTNGEFSIELNSGLINDLEIIDLTGRIIFSKTGTDSKINVNIGSFSDGIYYVKIKSDGAVAVIKVIKN